MYIGMLFQDELSELLKWTVEMKVLVDSRSLFKDVTKNSKTA